MSNFDFEESIEPELYKLPNHDSITDTKANVLITDNMIQPLISLGFHFNIHDDKNKLESEIYLQNDIKLSVTKKLEHQSKYVDNNILKSSTSFMENKIGRIPKIFNRAYFKMWEMLYYFDIAGGANFRSAHLAEAPGGFVQGTIYYRDLYEKNSKNDKYFSISLYQSDEAPRFDLKFIDYYKREKQNRYINYPTYPLDVVQKSSDKDNGDLTKIRTLNNFQKFILKNGPGGEGSLVNLVTADGGFPYQDENNQEMEILNLCLGEIICALMILGRNKLQGQKQWI